MADDPADPLPRLELEPYAPPPARAEETVLPPPLPEPGRTSPGDAEPALAQPSSWRWGTSFPPPSPPRRRPLLATPLASSLVIHLALFALVWLLWPTRWREPEFEPVATITLRDFHWVGNDPESEGTGPRGPGPNEPTDAKGREAEPGFADDDADRAASAGTGGGAVGSAFSGRRDGKEGLLAAGGGDGGTEGAVRMALEWLARHQEKDGTWSAHGFAKRCPAAPCPDSVDDALVVPSTALALLPFLGAGHTDREGPWKDVVRRGLAALLARQRADGTFDEGAKPAYGDAFATLVLAEAYGLTARESVGAAAQRAVAHWVATQNAAGGWRYAGRGEQGDTSVTGWVACALAAARRSGLAVPEETLAGCRRWFAEHTERDGLVSYVATGSGPTALLGVGIAVPVLLGAPPDDRRLDAVAARLARALPRWPRAAGDAATVYGAADPMHWYYGALASFQRGGDLWTSWNAAMRPLLLDHQERRGCLAGSWPAVGLTGEHGGRVVVTALCALTLEVYYRYPRAVAVR